MIACLYYLLLGLYTILLAISLFQYLTKKAPTGDATVDWAWGIFYSLGLAGFVFIALLFWNKPAIGLVILFIPLLFYFLPAIRRTMTDAFARFPVANTPLLVLQVDNTTKAKIHLKLECWFSTRRKGTYSLYSTFDFQIDPLRTMDFPLTAYQTQLLARKSVSVRWLLFEQVDMAYEGRAYVKEIQPCMQFCEESPEAFRTGVYMLAISADKNTDAFKQEVALLKANQQYGNGVF